MRWRIRPVPRPDLGALEQDLLRFGMAPRRVRRTLGELDAHFDDLVDDALTTGLDRELAERQALERLGAMQDIATAARTRPELRDWAHRFPYVALVVYPLGCLAALPAAPVIAYAGDLARWTACILLGGFVTAAMLLLLQLTITLG
jgi:hypothetical protein